MRPMFQSGMTTTKNGLGPFLFMGIILAVMVAGLIFTTNVAEETDQEVERQEKGKISSEITFIRTDFDPKVETWGPINDTTLQGQQDIPVEAFKKAADVVALRPWNRMFAAGNVVDKEVQGFATLDVEKAFADPDSIRGLPVEVLGRLETLEPFDLFDAYTHKLPDGRYKVQQGSLRCRKGKHKSAAFVHFTLLDERDEDAPILVPGAEVKLQGIFFKLQRYDTEKGVETGIWILAKRIHQSYKLPQGDEIDLRTLYGVHDAVTAVDAERDPLEERALYHLLGWTYEGHKPKPENVLKMKGKELRRLLNEPERYRGKTIEFAARIMRVDHHAMKTWFPEHDEEDNPVNEFWITYITPDDNIPMTVLWLKEPPKNLKKRDQVRMKATFYRVWGFKSQKGRAKSPFLVGLGEMEVFSVEQETGLDDPLTLGLIVFSVLVLILVIVVLRFDRRRAAVFADTMKAKKQMHRKSRILGSKGHSKE